MVESIKTDKELKKNVVKLSYISARSVKEVERELEINEQVFYRWRKISGK